MGNEYWGIDIGGTKTAFIIGDAQGRVLASAVISEEYLPSFDNSAMDGFAVRHAVVADASADHPVTLRVVADVPAGSV